MGAKHRPSEKTGKNIISDEISQKSYGIHTFEQKKNLETVIKMETEPVEEKLRRYKSNWLIYIKNDPQNIAKIMMNYRSKGLRCLGISLKGLLD